MRRIFIALLTLGAGLVATQPALAQFDSRARVAVAEANPSRVTLLRGEPAVRITLTGTGLDQLNTARVLLIGREVRDVSAKLLSTRTSTSRVLELRAAATGRESRGLEIVLGSTLMPRLALTVPAQVAVQMPPKPDLVIQSIQLSLVSGTETRATIRVANVGNGPAQTPNGSGIGLHCEVVYETPLSYTSSTPSTIALPPPPPPPPLDAALVEPLGPTQSMTEMWTFSRTLIYPSGATARSVVCEVDRVRAIDESNESNNRREQLISG
jgi:hypothetical protein